MAIALDFIVVLGMWAAQLFYVLCYIPQIIINYKKKSGRGLSELMLIGYFNGLVVFTFYSFLCNLPFIYKLSGVLQIIAVVILVGQRLYYDDYSVAKPYWILYGSNVIGSLIIIPVGLQNPAYFGWLAGWIMVIVSGVNQIPQIFKIFREKSVIGFSLLFVGFFLIAALIEFTTAIVVGLPIQTIVSSLRGITIGLIWIIQFWLYR